MQPQKLKQPIGIFDSGVGGLSVFNEVIKQLPHENIIYVADSANCPYGSKTVAQIKKLSQRILEFLIQQNCKLIIVACNTISVNAIKYLRTLTNIPLVAIEPATKLALRKTKNKRIGILATPKTFQGKLFQQTKKENAQQAKIYTQPGYGLVEQVEGGQLNSTITEKILKKDLDKLIQHNIDQLVLGCTHYPFLLPLIKKNISSSINIIDPAPAVARQVKRRLSLKNNINHQKQLGQYLFYTTGQPQVLANLLEKSIVKKSEIKHIKL